jgi:hypothetical protein
VYVLGVYSSINELGFKDKFNRRLEEIEIFIAKKSRHRQSAGACSKMSRSVALTRLKVL